MNPDPLYKYTRCPLWSNLHTEIVATLLPVHLTVRNVEEVLHSQLVPGGNLQQHHASWHVLKTRGKLHFSILLFQQKCYLVLKKDNCLFLLILAQFGEWEQCQKLKCQKES